MAQRRTFPPTTKEIVRAYFSKKLRSHLHCDTMGHALCFRDRISDMHREVSDYEFSIWVDALCEGEPILTRPPGILRFDAGPSAPVDFSDNESIRSSYHSLFWASSVSSGVPGPGYYAGKGLKWLGAKALIQIGRLAMRNQIDSELAKLFGAWETSRKTGWDYAGLLEITFLLTEYLR
ncbi:hypothetical protein M422DRAFT_269624 [Sphaerobolus stellatus SS14]|uniref:Uncharacterized protein n=1 Tax=Sphaerobolus stellatus (strain SS14) TaxID=990650 RepID=A0A0C9THP8_SPHS4|nr:hypothetical protein M422DRAFT_269624 [Sphaerobolus stellatus SS14]